VVVIPNFLAGCKKNQRVLHRGYFVCTVEKLTLFYNNRNIHHIRVVYYKVPTIKMFQELRNEEFHPDPIKALMRQYSGIFVKYLVKPFLLAIGTIFLLRALYHYTEHLHFQWQCSHSTNFFSFWCKTVKISRAYIEEQNYNMFILEIKVVVAYYLYILIPYVLKQMMKQ